MHSRRAPAAGRTALSLLLLLAASVPGLRAQTRITTPKEAFGFDIGADYHLANYQQLAAYWKTLASESDRMVLRDIGPTAEGRRQLMAIITSPANQKQLAHYRDIAQRVALAKGLTDEEARALAKEGKAVVWIDGGLHATEVLGAEQLIELVYEMVSRNDPETQRILDNVILLAVHANPDGMDLVSDWYNRNPVLEDRLTSGIPRLYEKYAGHDNNRDFYLSALPETQNMNRIAYRTWYPQIIYNHHQTGPEGAVMFAPPFRDPFNYNIDPLVISGIDLVGAAMQTSFIAHDMPGVTVRTGSSYSTWWNGGLRTEAYFHNMIGLLTETIGNPTPIHIPFVPARQLPKADMLDPIQPQPWHFAQSLAYELTADRAVLDLAARFREHFLFNIYRMGKNSIERGSTDHWTTTAATVEAAEAVADADNKRAPGEADYFGRRPDTLATPQFTALFREPAARDPRGYILPSDQPDFITATRFVNSLLDNGVQVLRAKSDFEVAGRHYPAGSYAVKTDQAFRPHVLDMFEPQHHPNDIPYPGAPPKPPYDNAGYTLALQMGVHFDRVLDGFDGPFEPIEGVDIAPPAGHVTGVAGASGYLLDHRANAAFYAVNRLLAAKQDVYWLRAGATVAGQAVERGTFYIPAGSGTRSLLEKIAADRGLDFTGTSAKPRGEAIRLRPVRIGLWDRYGGSQPSGWTRFLFERYGFQFRQVFARELDAGKLAKKFDVLVFVDGAIPSGERSDRGGRGSFGGQPDSATIPAQYRPWLGQVSVDTTVPQLERFLRDGGTIITEGSSTVLARHLGLPVADALVEPGKDGKERRLPSSKFYVPGSILSVRLDETDPLTAGMADPLDIFFDHSPVMRLGQGAGGVRPIAWFDSATPLVSGWAWGESFLNGGVEAAEAPVGKGHLFLFAPEITFRGQPAGTFKFLFNGIYYGTGKAVRMK